LSDPLYRSYHDLEWGVPERRAAALYEKLVLDGFQAGLAWITILRKREALREAFDEFDPERVARFDDAKVASLMADARIIRSPRKIASAIKSAQAYLEMMERGDDFAAYLWGYVDGRPVQNAWAHYKEAPAATPLSERIAKDLKRRGFGFCGPTIVYAFMQAVGMVNDHEVGCPRHRECAALA
jgi:DNA-3-methyladenine glycosylase I